MNTTNSLPTWKRRMTGIVLGTLAMSALTLCLVPAGPASAATCGQTLNAEVDGGEAGWSLSCHGTTITIDGWVRDTDADGKCAYVKASGNGQSMPQAKACPKNEKTFFQWKVKGSEIRAYLFTA